MEHFGLDIGLNLDLLDDNRGNLIQILQTLNHFPRRTLMNTEVFTIICCTNRQNISNLYAK